MPKLGGEIKPRWQHELDRIGPQSVAKGDNPAAAAEKLREAGILGIKYLDQGSRPSGEAWRLVDKYGTQEKALEVAKERLRTASLGDIRYWDNIVNQLSKPSTNNYVVFDADLINILRKYGIAGLPAAGVAAGVAQRDDTQ